MNAGIPFAQFQANLELDARLRLVLRSNGPETYYGAIGVFVAMVLHAATTGQQLLAGPAAQLYPAALVEPLRSVGLLTEAGSLTDEDYANYVGKVLEERGVRGASLQDRATKGGKARAASAVRDANGRMLPSAELQPATSQHAGSTSPDTEKSQTHSETDTHQISPFASAQGAAMTAAWTRTEPQWLEYVVESKPSGRKGKNGRPLNAAAERIARVGDYWQAHLGRPLPAEDGPRVAALIKDHPGGVTGLLADIAAMAMADPKGDALDYLTRKIAKRNDRGSHQQRPASSGRDYDAIIGARDAVH